MLIYTIRFLLEENMLELFLCLALSFLILGSMLFVLRHVVDVEDIKMKELQRLVNECLEHE